MELVLDIIKLIASFHKDTWYNLYRVDERFYEYARTDVGIREYIILAIEHRSINNGYKKETRLFGMLHSINDLPAVIYEDSSQYWFKNDLIHRDGDLPAVIYINGRQEWYKDGELHRDGDLPAVIYINGRQEWYKDGKLHRDGDLPAVIYINGRQEWYKDGIEIK